MALLDEVKLAMRISHTRLDSDIEDTIETSRLEMIRTGVFPDVAYSDDPLIKSAIKTYCRMTYASDEKMMDGYRKSWLYQVDSLRKSGGYGIDV